jgi:magnesium chelatase subunit D
MTAAPGSGAAAWDDARLAAALFAIDGPGLGGVRLRARVGPVRERWLQCLRLLCADQPMPRLPLHADVERLAGSLDLAATLRAGRPVAERGLLQEADGGVLLIPLAERLEPELAATLGAVMETGRVVGSVSTRHASARRVRFGVVALDEGAEPDECVHAGLADRLALHVDLGHVGVRELSEPTFDAADIDAARRLLPEVRFDEPRVETLCAAAVALGIASMRIPWLAYRAACAAAALDGRRDVADGDLAVAARLVLAPRATRMPASENEADDAGEAPPDPSEPESAAGEDDASPPDAPDDAAEPDASDDEVTQTEASPTELILEAARASIPPGLLDGSLPTATRAARRSRGGKSGALNRSGVRGRPAGVRRGRPGTHARLNLIETLRAAAPWQKLRRAPDDASSNRPRIQVRQDDFRVTRFKQRRETTTVFVVDASGSAALHRLAEAKGAVELLLADCYVRRDRVALVSFRGTRAEVLLPPTRSLVRAKRRLAGLPGGGGTPLAAGLDSALALGGGILRQGATPVIVVLTDGRANIAADGAPGRERAHADALAAAQRLRGAGLTVLLIDTSPRPRPTGQELAAAMGARYLPLPQADAAHLSAAVRAETP